MRRRRVWSVDPLEGRDLLSITPILGLIGSPVVSSLAAGTGAGGGGSSSGSNTGGANTATSGTAGPGAAVDLSTQTNAATGITYYANNGGNGITTDASPPRPNEVARRMFRGTFSGRVLEEPPRLYDQARQFYILAPGNTNQFLHGTLQMRYYTPEPGSGVTVTTGSLSMSDRSTQSGGVILADLSGSPTAVDARGRPTQFILTLNGGGGSGGQYASSSGQGTVTIRYKGNIARVLVTASIFTLGVGNPLDVFQSNIHH